MTHHRFASAGLGLALLALPAAAAAPGAAAPGWVVDHAKSTLGFSGVGNGSAFEGSFGTWEAAIRFDPDHLDASGAEVTIDTASVATDDTARAEYIAEKDWLGPALFPSASFATRGIARTGADAYVADATLTIRGVSQEVKLPFTLTITGNHAEMAGTLTLDRGQWGIGAGTWQDHSVDPAVTVTVKLAADRS